MTIKFYKKEKTLPIETLYSDFVPRKGDLVEIYKINYEVISVLVKYFNGAIAAAEITIEEVILIDE